MTIMSLDNEDYDYNEILSGTIKKIRQTPQLQPFYAFTKEWLYIDDCILWALRHDDINMIIAVKNFGSTEHMLIQYHDINKTYKDGYYDIHKRSFLKRCLSQSVVHDIAMSDEMFDYIIFGLDEGLCNDHFDMIGNFHGRELYAIFSRIDKLIERHQLLFDQQTKRKFFMHTSFWKREITKLT